MLEHPELFSSADNISDNVSDLSKKALFNRFNKELSERGWDALPGLTKQYFESLNIQPIFERQNDSSFGEMRHRLETDSGIIISNHPGYFDYPIILGALGRDDVKIFVSEDAYEQWVDIVGSDHFLEATTDPRRAKKIFEDAGEHIEKGGVILIFPTGTQEHLANEERDETPATFKSGFKFLLKHSMRPTDMVYSFHIESDDIQSIIGEKIRRGWSAASGMFFTEAANLNRLKETKMIHVDEHCTDAAEWQKLAGAGKADADVLLTRHFEEQFNLHY